MDLDQGAEGRVLSNFPCLFSISDRARREHLALVIKSGSQWNVYSAMCISIIEGFDDSRSFNIVAT